MKPTKNRVFCKDSGRLKMVFETEKKANTFIKFNSAEIEAESGFGPSRSYYCLYCNGWHVTSKKAKAGADSPTEIVLDQYRREKEARRMQKAKAAQIRQENAETLNNHLRTIEKLFREIEVARSNGSKDQCMTILNHADTVMKLAKSIKGGHKGKKVIESRLELLRSEIEEIA